MTAIIEPALRAVKVWPLPASERLLYHATVINWLHQQWQRPLRRVILHVTDRCPWRCRTCFVPRGTTDLSLQRARQAARSLGRFRWLDIGGGEPFLHPDLVEICRAFQCQSITIPTSGWPLARVVAAVERLLAEAPAALTVAVSMDGPPDCNDAIRGAGSHDIALAALGRLRALPGLTLKVNTVVSNENYPVLLEFMDQVHGLGPDYHSLLLLRGAPGAPDLTLPPMSWLRAQTPEILDKLGRYAYGQRRGSVKGRLMRNYQAYLWEVSLRTLEQDRCIVPCQAPRLHRVVHATGATAMCELMPEAGNIFSQGVAHLERRMRRDFDRFEARHGKCHCTHNCNMGQNIMLHWPSLMRVVLGRTG